jgi:Raf kinase inhibitor-like YbhB/YbcL family protein
VRESGSMPVNVQEIKVELGFSQFPVDETCDGADYSPLIKLPDLDAPYFALIVDDIDDRSGSFIHWTLYNAKKVDEIPRNLPKRPDLDNPIKGMQGRNDFGDIGYGGPCPPRGKPHRYIFRAYGLEGPLDIGPGATKADLERAMKGRIKQYGETVATYSRK